MSKIINILIVEDEELLRTGLKLIFQNEEDMNVVGTAENGLVAMNLLRDGLQPDIIILDIEMPIMNGIECIQEVRKLHPELPILILSSHDNDDYIFQAIAYGANGYILKGSQFDMVIQTLRDVIYGQYVLTAEVGKRIAQYVLKSNQFLKERGINKFFDENEEFTDIEKELISLLITGLSNKNIADHLHFSEGTIKNKLTVIYNKLGVKNRQETVELLESYAVH